MKEMLTNSRMACFKECRRKHQFAYEIGLRRIEDARALRMGSAFHDGIAELSRTFDDADAQQAMAEVLHDPIAEACRAIGKHYANCPAQFDLYEWQIEHETIRRLVCAYEWRWKNAGLVYVATEFPFRIPLVNPATGKTTPIFDLAGKIDGIVRLEDGRLAIKETKTMSEDIGNDSPLWRRMRMDHQVSLYIHAARTLGYSVDTVLYDVCRKPSISATAVPLTDENGIKIVLDASGERIRNASGKKEWRQTGDVERGWILQTRPMTVQEWGDKLTADICERPDFYFARQEVPRLDGDIDEYQSEIWDIQLAVREAQKSGRHYRTVNKQSCGFCTYFDLCSTNTKINPANPPMGFEILNDPHPELNGEVNHVSTSSTASSSAETAPSTADAIGV